MSQTLSCGITTRPCWIQTLPLKSVIIKNVELKVYDGVEEIYYDIEGDKGLRYRTYQPDGLPPAIWAPDGFELPGEGETAEVLTYELWGHRLVIFDWDWFMGLELLHDTLNRGCPICTKMREDQGG